MDIDNKSKAERNIGLEWLRICSMLMIILLHSIDHSGLLENLVLGSPLYYYEQFLYALVQVCVNCFVLISGYFLVNSKFKFEKLISLWIEVVFYSLIIKIVMMALGEIPFSVISLVSCFVPVLTGRYWFLTIYFGMYLLSPFINIAIKAMNEKQHRELLILLFILFSVMISIHPSFKGMNSGSGWGLTWFIVLYFIAAYIRLHYRSDDHCIKSLVLFFICPFLMLVALWGAQKLGVSSLIVIAQNLWRYDSALVLVASIAIFIAFLNNNSLKSRRMEQIIIRVSAATFGVYLIHAHADMCTEKMWQRMGIISNLNFQWFPLYQLGLILIIFIVCVILDIIRVNVFGLLGINQIPAKVIKILQHLFMRGSTNEDGYKN